MASSPGIVPYPRYAMPGIDVMDGAIRDEFLKAFQNVPLASLESIANRFVISNALQMSMQAFQCFRWPFSPAFSPQAYLFNAACSYNEERRRFPRTKMQMMMMIIIIMTMTMMSAQMGEHGRTGHRIGPVSAAPQRWHLHVAGPDSSS